MNDSPDRPWLQKLAAKTVKYAEHCNMLRKANPIFRVVDDIGSVFDSAVTGFYAHIPHGNVNPTHPGSERFNILLFNLSPDQARRIVEIAHEVAVEPIKSSTRNMKGRVNAADTISTDK